MKASRILSSLFVLLALVFGTLASGACAATTDNAASGSSSNSNSSGGGY